MVSLAARAGGTCSVRTQTGPARASDLLKHAFQRGCTYTVMCQWQTQDPVLSVEDNLDTIQIVKSDEVRKKQ